MKSGSEVVPCFWVVVMLCLCRVGLPKPTPHQSGTRGSVPRVRLPNFADPSAKVFDILDFGAQPDHNHRKDNYAAFEKAWKAACRYHGNAKVLVPSGTFLTGPVILNGPCFSFPIALEVVGTVKALTDASRFPDSHWFFFDSIDGLLIYGSGVFDGQGHCCWKYSNCKDCRRLPVNLKFNDVRNGVLKGISSVNSKGFHIFLSNCEHFSINSVHITAPSDSPNTDGIHISRSDFVKIGKSGIGTGDDCVSIGQGSTNVFVNQVTCGPGHGISVGSLGKYADEGDVRSIKVKNCTLTDTNNGLRIKTWPDSPRSEASDIIFDNIIMNNVKNPIIIDQEYCNSRTCKPVPSHVKISDVHFTNIKGTTISPVAVNLVCSKDFPCQDITLLNVDLKYNPKSENGVEAFSQRCSNAKVRYGGLQNPPPCKTFKLS